MEYWPSLCSVRSTCFLDPLNIGDLGACPHGNFKNLSSCKLNLEVVNIQKAVKFTVGGLPSHPPPGSVPGLSDST